MLLCGFIACSKVDVSAEEGEEEIDQPNESTGQGKAKYYSSCCNVKCWQKRDHHLSQNSSNSLLDICLISHLGPFIPSFPNRRNICPTARESHCHATLLQHKRNPMQCKECCQASGVSASLGFVEQHTSRDTKCIQINTKLMQHTSTHMEVLLSWWTWRLQYCSSSFAPVRRPKDISNIRQNIFLKKSDVFLTKLIFR